MAQAKGATAKYSAGKSMKSAAGKITMSTVNEKNVPTSKVRFGSVVVSTIGPKQTEMRRNVNSGQLALARATTRIVRAGVSIPEVSSVPLYHADPKESGRLIRELNGKLSRGMFVGGKFRILSKS